MFLNANNGHRPMTSLVLDRGLADEVDQDTVVRRRVGPSREVIARRHAADANAPSLQVGDV